MALVLVLVAAAVVLGAVIVWSVRTAGVRRQRLVEDYADHAPPIHEQQASKKYWRAG